MLGKGKLLRDGTPAQALVLEKKVYASGVQSNEAKACTYRLRVRFEDGSTAEITRRVMGAKLSSAAVGELIPVRYDPGDRTKIEIDAHAIDAERDAALQARNAQAIAHGERELEGVPDSFQPPPDTGSLLLADSDREQVESVLRVELAAGRLTVDELEGRVGTLLKSRTRQEARGVLSGLPVPTSPAWLAVPAAPAAPSHVVPHGPADEEIAAAEKLLEEKAARAKAAKAAHKQAEAGGDKRATLRAFNDLQRAKAAEKSARAKVDGLRRQRL